ncbi:2-amino-4-hydroxy-6-hydroxymethyldihydropteridine diphosphokinase [Corynebacterium kalidii]
MNGTSGRSGRNAEGLPAVLAFGSNMPGALSGPEEQIRTAAEALAAVDGVTPVSASAMFATSPWGVTDQDEFRNCVFTVQTTLDPLTLLHHCQGLEQAARRVRDRHWGPRTLDIDVIDYAGVRSDGRWGEELVLPHPWAHQRPFVLVPWLDADPEATLDGRPVREWLAACGGPDDGIRALPDVRWAP